MRRLSFPAFPARIGPALLTGLVILLAAITDGGQAFAIFRPLEQEGFWWLSIPAMSAGLIAMAWFSYLAIMTRSAPSLAGIGLIALAFLLASWAYVKPAWGDGTWVLVAKAVRALLPTGGGVAAGVAFGLVMREKRQEQQQAEDSQWRLLAGEAERDKAKAGLLAEQNERYRLQTERKLALQAGRQASFSIKRVEQVTVEGEGQVGPKVLAAWRQAQAQGIDPLAYTERNLAQVLTCSSWIARQVRLLASGKPLDRRKESG